MEIVNTIQIETEFNNLITKAYDKGRVDGYQQGKEEGINEYYETLCNKGKTVRPSGMFGVQKVVTLEEMLGVLDDMTGRKIKQRIHAIHSLKILPAYYKDVLLGNKDFELRKNDRDYQIGDTLILKEWSTISDYTGREITKTIKYILKDCPEYGLKDGYCILGLE